MNTTITPDNIHTLTNRALIIAKSLLQDQYVELTSRWLRHGYASGFEAYTAEKKLTADTIALITEELKRRYQLEMDRQAALEDARAQVAAKVRAAA